MILTRTMLASALIASSATAAFAQSAWDGAYAGLLYSNTSGTINYSTPAELGIQGNGYGAFAGYNFSANNIVYGAELAFQDLSNVAETASPTYTLGNTTDLKARVGLSAGNALIYGTVGWSESVHNISGDIEHPNGMIYGVGVDYRVGSRFFVGLEYLVRDISGPTGAAFYETNFSINTLSLRAGVTF